MSKGERWLLGLPVLLLTGVLHSNAQTQTTSINIKNAIELALANNYSLKADSLNNQVADYRVGVARADLRPQVNFSSKAEYNPELPSQMLPGRFINQPIKTWSLFSLEHATLWVALLKQHRPSSKKAPACRSMRLN